MLDGNLGKFSTGRMLADELSGAQDFASYGCSYQVMDVEVDVDEDV